MFASTNLVIELGILILIFLGWQFLAAEIIGGLVLIIISLQLVKWTYPKEWLKNAREKVEQDAGSEENDFDWRKRIRSAEGWRLVGNTFLMVPPLVEINARYYGWRVALYIAGIMYVSIVATALILHYGFAFLGITPESARAVKEVAQFKLDYTFWMNLAAVGLVGWLSWLNRAWHRHNEGMDMGGGNKIKKFITFAALGILVVGMAIHLVLGLI